MSTASVSHDHALTAPAAIPADGWSPLAMAHPDRSIRIYARDEDPETLPRSDRIFAIPSGSIIPAGQVLACPEYGNYLTGCRIFASERIHLTQVPVSDAADRCQAVDVVFLDGKTLSQRRDECDRAQAEAEDRLHATWADRAGAAQEAEHVRLERLEQAAP